MDHENPDQRRGLDDAAKLERNRQWREENADALMRYAEEVAQIGLPLRAQFLDKQA